MRNEDDARGALLSMMGPRWAVDRVENRAHLPPGFPDLVYTRRGTGLIEMKYIEHLQSKKVDVGLTAAQAECLRRHGRAGSKARVVVGVGRGNRLYLFTWAQCSALLRGVSPKEFLDMSTLITASNCLELF